MVLAVVKVFFPEIAAEIERILGIGEQVVQKALVIKDTAVATATAAAGIASAVPGAVAGLGAIANPATLQKLAQQHGKIVVPSSAASQEQQPQTQQPQLMKGGGQTSILDYATVATLAAVVGGGILLAVGRSLNAEGQNDSPPHPRDV
jgi:hypothetical protein